MRLADDKNRCPPTYEFGGHRLMPDRRRLLGPDGEAVVLRGKVFDLLLHLIENRGQVVEKAALMEALWPNVVVDENNLNQAMTSLRQALGENAQTPRFVATIKGRGYQFIGDVRVVDSETPHKADDNRRIWPFLAGGAAAVGLVLATFWINANGPPESSTVLDEFNKLSPRLVTDFHGSHSQPTLSPDGTMMAWLSDIDGTPHVWVGNLQEGDPIQITHGDLAADSPSWSPDNSRIIYERAGPKGKSIYSVDTLGTSPPRLLLEGAENPSYAQRSDQFVYTRGRQVWIASGDGSNARKIENLPIDQGFAERMPALSPDGSLIAFVHAEAGPIGNLWVIESRPGAKPRQLTAYDLNELQSVHSPTFSPNGEEIVFSLIEKNGTSGLWRIPVDGGEPEVLTTSSGTFNFPAVSANGRRVVYTDRRLSSKLVVINPDTAERRTIYESRRMVVLPMASPSGSQIVFFSPLSSGAQVMTIASDGRSLRQRTSNDGGMNTLPIFGAEEDAIYYYADDKFIRQHLDEGRTEVILENFHWSTRNWPAIFEDRIAYHEMDRTVGKKRAVIHNISDASDIELPVAMEALSWSQDGRELLGFVRNPGDITICDVESLSCEALSSLGTPVRGYLPRWSRDEQRIFFLKWSASSECCDLWMVNRDGSGSKLVADLGAFDTMNSYIGVTDQDEVFYNMVDGGDDEIWLIAMD